MRRKVYKGQLFALGEHEPSDVYVAADNWQQVAKVAGCSVYHVRKYWQITGFNAPHRLSAQAFRNPGVIIWGEPPRRYGSRPPIGANK